MKGGDNAVADALSRIDVHALQHQTGTIDYGEMASAQSTDPEIQRLQNGSTTTSLVLKAIPLEGSNLTLFVTLLLVFRGQWFLEPAVGQCSTHYIPWHIPGCEQLNTSPDIRSICMAWHEH